MLRLVTLGLFIKPAFYLVVFTDSLKLGKAGFKCILLTERLKGVVSCFNKS